MPPKKDASLVRVRVTFPVQAWEQIEALAAKVHMEPTLLVRFMASVQLAQWQLIIDPRSAMKTDPELQGVLTQNFMQTMPELQAAVDQPSQPEPEPEPEPERPPLGLRPRNELDDMSSYRLLENMLSFR